MKIADEIAKVNREFVSGGALVDAIAAQEGLPHYHVASWLLRHAELLDSLPFYELHPVRGDFEITKEPWATDPLLDIVRGEEASWSGNVGADYVGGWLSSHLKAFFKEVDVDYPETELSDAPLTVTTEASRQLPVEDVDPQGAPESDVPLATRERTTLLTIIAALAEEAKVSLVTPSKSADLIAGMTARMGTPVGKRTIEEHLKRIPDALERKAK